MEETTSLSSGQQAGPLEVLLGIARDLTASLGARDRYARLLQAVRQAIPCDAACLLRLDGHDLVPVAAHGLSAPALARRYDRREHPRLDVILRSAEPVRFPDSRLPDPFDGLLEHAPHALSHIHACLGCALTEGGEVVGALTADALAPRRLRRPRPALPGHARGAGRRRPAHHRPDRGPRAARRAPRRVAREVLRNVELSGGEILGQSAAVRQLREQMALVAASDLAVLVTGETGVGKEIVVRQIHAASARRDEALIQVNCAALPESIAESELFGHVPGAFTGAQRERAGKFEVAHGGTLFLDEIGELPLTLQPKLLRALQQGEVQRVGSDRLLRVDVRVIAATNRDLPHEVERGRFRADLFHRLAVFPVQVPSLRERREDVPMLAAHFVDVARRRLGLGRLRLSEEARARLQAADWPGNVRELENVVNRAVLRAAHGRDRDQPLTIGVEHLDLVAGSAAPPAPLAPPAPEGRVMPLREQLEEFQRRAVLAAVERHGGRWAAAARELGLHRSNLHHLARRLGLKPTAGS